MKKALITLIVVATIVAFSPAVFSHGGRMKGNAAAAQADPAPGPGAMHDKGKGKAKGKGKGKGRRTGKGGPGHGGERAKAGQSGQQ